MLLTEQDAKTKWCWQPRNAENKCKASGCAMWRWWPIADPIEQGYCGLASAPLTMEDIHPPLLQSFDSTLLEAQTEIIAAEKRKR